MWRALVVVGLCVAAAAAVHAELGYWSAIRMRYATSCMFARPDDDTGEPVLYYLETPECEELGKAVQILDEAEEQTKAHVKHMKAIRADLSRFLDSLEQFVDREASVNRAPIVEEFYDDTALLDDYRQSLVDAETSQKAFLESLDRTQPQ